MPPRVYPRRLTSERQGTPPPSHAPIPWQSLTLSPLPAPGAGGGLAGPGRERWRGLVTDPLHRVPDVRTGQDLLRQREAHDGGEQGAERAWVIGRGVDQAAHRLVRRRPGTALPHRGHFCQAEAIGADLVVVERGHVPFGALIPCPREGRRVTEMAPHGPPEQLGVDDPDADPAPSRRVGAGPGVPDRGEPGRDRDAAGREAVEAVREASHRQHAGDRLAV